MKILKLMDEVLFDARMKNKTPVCFTIGRDQWTQLMSELESSLYARTEVEDKASGRREMRIYGVLVLRSIERDAIRLMVDDAILEENRTA